MSKKKIPHPLAGKLSNFEEELNARVELDRSSIASRVEGEIQKNLQQDVEVVKQRQRDERERQLARQRLVAATQAEPQRGLGPRLLTLACLISLAWGLAGLWVGLSAGRSRFFEILPL